MGSITNYASQHCPLFGPGQLTTANEITRYDLFGTLYVGQDDTGYDVMLYGATSGSYWLWDESLDALLLKGAMAVIDGFLGSKTTVTSLTSGATVTYSAAQIVGGYIIDTITLACTATTATAAQIIAAIDNAQVGTSFFFLLANKAATAISITLAGGTDVTITGTATVAQSNTKIFRVVVTAATTVTIYSVGTLVH